MRVLAQRRAQAAEETKILVGDSVARAKTGSHLAGDAGRTMTPIVDQFNQVTDPINAISHASAEQSQGIDQVGDAVTPLDRGTQQNAALVEASAAVAERLNQQPSG